MRFQHKMFLAVLSFCIGWVWLFVIADSEGRECIEAVTAVVLIFGGGAFAAVTLANEHNRKQFEKTED